VIWAGVNWKSEIVTFSVAAATAAGFLRLGRFA
jgi:hypothetical protein